MLSRANDHGCHDPCSEQHGSRQPWSWLILNVGQNMRYVTALIGSILLITFCACRPDSTTSRNALLQKDRVVLGSKGCVFVQLGSQRGWLKIVLDKSDPYTGTVVV